MSIRKRQLVYGWFDKRVSMFRVSREPPDAPIRPSFAYPTKAEIDQIVTRKRWDIMWSPPLEAHQMATGENQ